EYANVHRGVHYLSQHISARYEAVRQTVARFINAGSEHEIVFTRGGTEAINLVAASYGRTFLKEGDEVVVSAMEHHANIVPWQLLQAERGIVLKVAPIDDEGLVHPEAVEPLLGPRTRLVAMTQVSNVLGTEVPIKTIARMAHERGIPILVDGCQAIVHMPIDVRDLDVDF